MLKNYFKVALRNILKYRFFSAINILGMTIGITSCLLIILFISNELSFDRFHKDAERIYAVGLHGKLGGQDIMAANTCPPMAAALVADIPEIESATRLYRNGAMTVRLGDKTFTEKKILYADSNFFEFFTFPILAGDPKSALKEPNSIVLTKDAVVKYFAEEDPLGKILTLGDDKKAYKVTGVLPNTPPNSSIQFTMLLSASSSTDLKTTQWLNNFMYNYFKIRPNTHVEDVTKKFEGLTEKYVGPEVEKFMGTTIKQLKASGGDYGYYAVKITDLHLASPSTGDLEPGGDITYIYFFGGIGIFIVLIACINFMNLSTARSAGRAKEVGLRKTLGGLRGQMIAQFLSESLIYSLAALILSLVTCYFLLPSFNTLAGKSLTMAAFNSPWFIAGIIGLLFIVGVVAGSYPAFYLTSFNAVEVLKGKVRAGMKTKGIRSFLVIFQFAISIILIICTIVVYQQITYMQEKNMGINKNNVLIIKSTDKLGSNKQSFRNALDQQSEVVKSSYTNNYFPGVNNTTVIKSKDLSQDHIVGIYFADYSHMDVIKFELKEGRYFSRDFPSDSTAVLLNEAATKEFGFDSSIGQEIMFNNTSPDFHPYKVIGVIKNFNFESFKNQVRPLALFLTNTSRNLLVRYEGNPKKILAKIERLWKEQAGSEPFEYEFMDEGFDELFRSEQKMGQICTVFTGLAIFIAGLGLFALAAFTSEQRTKEIGIRKSMGASVFSLTLLLSREFTSLVIIAFVPAAGLGWYLSHQWLEGFVYRTEVSPFVYLLSGLCAIVIAWLTVSFQALKAAGANPVESLRYE